MRRFVVAGAAGLLLGGAILPAAPAVAAPPWCARARGMLDEVPLSDDGAWERYAAIVDQLPVTATPVTEYARRRAGEDGALDSAYAALRVALADGCREVAVRGGAGDPAAQVGALMAADERFVGARLEPDAVDRIKASISEWLEELLESQLMQKYAGASRSVYLAVLGLFVAFVAARLWRARARRRHALAVVAADVRVTRLREKAFAAWREEASAHLARGELRKALRAGQLALLARVGEVDRDAVNPARTNREVLASVGDAERALLRPPLELFERAFFGGQSDGASAAAFLDAVDNAAAAIAGVTGGS